MNLVPYLFAGFLLYCQPLVREVFFSLLVGVFLWRFYRWL
jgi:hypothetical protein